MKQPAEDDKGGRGAAAVQSVDRALLVLEILAKLGTAGVTELAGELGVHKSTVSRLVAVLEARGYVEQLTDRGKYRLGFSIVRLAGSTTAQIDLAKQGQATCDRLANSIGETVNLAILDGGRAVNIVEAAGPAGVALRTWVGQSSPLHATSSGKVLLSELSPTELRRNAGEQLESFTPNTVVDFGVLESQLSAVRAVGWASVSEELEIGLNAVAAPVRDHSSNVVAALSVSGPTYRLEAGRFEDVAQRAIDAAGGISRRLGYVG
ncbi:IclR family transcriptional regulator [Antrihabitans cavernicola]|uniref:Glycerol operon regulatory protein n=1 Tax=Antrihabitans cavernicola TaxID=2495913 RepID=A0A5A7SAE9_9NOCA|nr:IclR family transcriptional regulator [Spelaeibacter cavernicola]KAA0021505.1 IclR family transcriptional regulator [Spelaeibacter cavernicola]